MLANGHVYSADQALDVLTQTKACGLMIGRGVIRSPWLFNQIRQRQRGEPVTFPTGREVLEYISLLYESQASFDAPEKIQVERMKKFMNYLGEGVGAERRAPSRPVAESASESQLAEAVLGAPISGGFLHQIRRAETRADFFRICDDFLGHDQPMNLEPAR